MGRLPTLQLMALKAAHDHELLGMITGYERPLAATTLRPARDSCEGCHWPAVNHDDKVAPRSTTSADAKNTEMRTRLIVHTGGGEAREKATRGIHWHVDQNVEYVSDDEQKRTIPWVRITGKDGKSTTYFDASSKVGRADMDQKTEARGWSAPTATMPPGIRSRTRPTASTTRSPKAGSTAASLDQGARAGDHREGRRRCTARWRSRSRSSSRSSPTPRPRATLKPASRAEAKFAQAMLEILKLSEFEAKDLTWKSFPNHVGHKDFPGCFRCHDGKHFNEKGEAIRLQCTLCHDIPQVTVNGTLKTVQSTMSPAHAAGQPRGAELDADHRKADDSCTMCHGPIKWGSDGGNSARTPPATAANGRSHSRAKKS